MSPIGHQPRVLVEPFLIVTHWQ